MESDGSSDVDGQGFPSNEEESDSVEVGEENEEQPASFHIAGDLSHKFHGNHSSYEFRIDIDETGGEPLNPDQAPNDEEISGEVPTDEFSMEFLDDEAQDDEGPDEQIEQHVPFLANNQRGRPGRGSISVVPPHFREVDGTSYTPKCVSIGPIHHNREGLWLTEEKKRQFLGPLLDEKNKQYLESGMKDLEPKVRRFYSMTFQGMSSDDFVDMLLIDGCFIVVLFCLNHKWRKEGINVADPIFSTRWRLPSIGRDLLMIENQLPLFVLQKIFNLTRQIPDETSFNVTKLIPDGTSFKEVALEFIKSFHIGTEDMVIKEHHTEGHHKHLLDLFHSLYLPPKSSDSGAAQERRRKKKPLTHRPSVQGKSWGPSATALKSSGVSFYAKKGNPLEIQFRRGRLRIPSISLDESSIIILKNLLAYEQSSRDIQPLFTSLVMFFSNMASGPDDIKLLREASIILHQPGDDQMLIEVLKLLSKQLECDVRDCTMKKQVEDIRAFCGSNLVKMWNSVGRILAQNAVRFILLYLSL